MLYHKVVLVEPALLVSITVLENNAVTIPVSFPFFQAAGHGSAPLHTPGPQVPFSAGGSRGRRESSGRSASSSLSTGKKALAGQKRKALLELLDQVCGRINPLPLELGPYAAG